MFDVIAVERPAPEDAQPGELWLTAGDDAAMVLVRSVRANGSSVVVVPVVFDVEVADGSAVVLDENASPLAVPIAIWETLLVSLPTTALRERVVVTRPNVDLLHGLSKTAPGVFQGSPLEGPTDPRHEVRQYLIDRLTALDPYEPDDGGDDQAGDETDRAPEALLKLVQDEFAWRRPWCDVAPLPSLPVDQAVAHLWIGVCRIVDLTTHIAVIQVANGLSEPREFANAQALLVRLNASALALCTPATDLVDLYDAPTLFRAIELPEGQRASRPLISGLSLVDALDKYLGQKRLPLSAIVTTAHRAPRVHTDAVLAAALDRAVDDTVARASRLAPEKRAGYEQLARWKADLKRTLTAALEPDFDAAMIERLVQGDDR
jgi:hypothetical protein